MIQSEIIRSAHDCSEGGLAISLAESCIARAGHMIGVVVDLDVIKKDGMRMDDTLFGEAPSRIVVSVKASDLQKLEEIAGKHSIPYYKLGEVRGTQFIVRNDNRELINMSVTALSDGWRNAIPARVKSDN